MFVSCVTSRYHAKFVKVVIAVRLDLSALVLGLIINVIVSTLTWFLTKYFTNLKVMFFLCLSLRFFHQLLLFYFNTSNWFFILSSSRHFISFRLNDLINHVRELVLYGLTVIVCSFSPLTRLGSVLYHWLFLEGPFEWVLYLIDGVVKGFYFLLLRSVN